MKKIHNIINDYYNYKKYYLKPGYIYVSKDPVIITTVLGSCISVCIYDNELKYGGMNHYLLPQIKTNEKATTKYGDIAIHTLIKTFFEFGSKKENLIAKIAGGAYIKDISDSKIISESNIKICKDILYDFKINIIEEDIGNIYGRKLDFYSDINKLVIKKLKK